MLLRKIAAGLGLGALAAAIVLGLASSTDLLERVELTTYDWRMRLAADPRSINKDIVLVEINDASIREMSPTFGRWPWPRLAISFAIDFLRRAPAKVIGVDIALPETDAVDRYKLDDDYWTGRQSDRALVDYVRSARNDVMLADAVYEGLAGKQKDPTAAIWPDSGYHALNRAEPRPVVLAPFQALTDAAAAL